MIGLPKTTSRWRQSAHQRIAEALAALPIDATLKQKRAVLRAANPWKGGPEHGKKMWRLEVDLALADSATPAPLPKWYKVADSAEQALLNAIREADLDRASMYFDSLTMLVLADWYEERDDRRGPAWRLLGSGKAWPICNATRTVWQWHRARHMLRANWETDAAIFDQVPGRVGNGEDDSGRKYSFRNYKSLFVALCVFAVAHAKVILP